MKEPLRMEKTNELKALMLLVTQELISGCRFCMHIASDPEDKTPIHCIKYSGCSVPVRVNAATCLSCQEYKRSGKQPEKPGCGASG